MKQWIVRAMLVVLGIWLGAELLLGDWADRHERQAVEVPLARGAAPVLASE
ncbi:MAG: hypothetical protein CM15mP74_06250 [Halieaceae bacterium]|nr:MAG: hypothetical protein CM15mP74_06250 [Halieaceae bacterium]